ncbi:hypothetical protein [Cryptosporangium aurantiacum]|uniref:Uncharacterized protein n=1 Tax=Cryptosporangium aurantiacum TaxID=134849 RepID=A0A1M7RND4_9ACTN|nr:hypothetical protein [Cryptosporangium aurantiacum]SHN47719.1 hypothetical protein SAMN05443668_12722 [Cryptosporangium aurantiacum]
MNDRTEELVRAMLETRSVEAGERSLDVDALVRRGEWVRRRRQLGAITTTAVAAVVVILTATLLVKWNTGTEAIRPVKGHGAPVDLTVVDGEQLRTKDGEVTVPMDLTALGARVTEVRDGWMSLSRTSELSFINASGAVTPIADNIDSYLIDGTGTRIAFTRKGGLAVGVLRDGRVTGLVPTPSAHEAYPVAFVGERVVMMQAGSCCGGDNQQYVEPRFAVWDPPAGGFTPRWTTGVTAVHGPVLDGTRLLATVRQGSVNEDTGCLALLRPSDLSVLAKQCDLGLSAASTYGTLSPSGRYFFDLVVTSGREYGVLMTIGADLGNLTRTDFPTPDEPPTWDDDTALATVNRHLYLWRSGQEPERIQRFANQTDLAPRPFVRD